MRAPEMIHPTTYASLGEMLAEALVQFKSETALIEVDRRRETKRLTYLEAKHEVAKVAAFLEARGIGADDRVAIVMSNQNRWLIAAMRFFRGGRFWSRSTTNSLRPNRRACLRIADPLR